jgi:hypothetical protein
MKKLLFTLSWKTKTEFNQERIGAMYCFKRCDINWN